MSEEQFHARLGKLLQELPVARRELELAKSRIDHLVACLAAIAESMQVEPGGRMQNPGRAAQVIADLPEDLTPGLLRESIARYQEKLARVASIESELKPYL